jgi:predicted RNA-binding protein with PIN domain
VPYLIDGNNLLGSWGGPRGDDDRRAEVVRRVAEFCRMRGARATVVFDGHPLRGDMAQQLLGDVTLRVPERGQDADTVIRELIDRAPRPSDLLVVSSDKELYSYAKTMGASAIRAHEWNALERQLQAQRGRSAEATEKPEREDDLSGWLKKFGASE